MTELTLGDAARRIGVSVDTLRRWAAAGKLSTSFMERFLARQQRPGGRLAETA